MKPVSPELLALLATRQFLVADIYTFDLADGSTLRYCGGDQDLTVNGQLYPAGKQTGPYFDRRDNKAHAHQMLGLEADQLIVDVIPGSATVLGAPFMEAVRSGVFDGAECTLEKVYMPTWGDTRRGTLRWFIGRVVEIDGGRSVATFAINSHLELLNQQVPRNLYQVGCLNNLGDGTCQATVPTGSATVAATSTVSRLYVTISGSFPAGAFDLGKATFTSGALAGISATMRSVAYGTPAQIDLVGFLPSAPAIGDALTLSYGCNKSPTDSNGCPKFSNLAHFRGFPYVPQPSTAV